MEEREQHLIQKERELQNLKSEMDKINAQEHNKVEELMGIIEKKSREIQDKEEYFRKITEDVDTNLNFIREKETHFIKEKEKVSTTNIKLQNLEKEMHYENEQFKKA
jgi:hypothetical protein